VILCAPAYPPEIHLMHRHDARQDPRPRTLLPRSGFPSHDLGDKRDPFPVPFPPSLTPCTMYTQEGGSQPTTKPPQTKTEKEGQSPSQGVGFLNSVPCTPLRFVTQDQRARLSGCWTENAGRNGPRPAFLLIEIRDSLLHYVACSTLPSGSSFLQGNFFNL
jgi:hypothetical protein